jgi:cell wall-associated NlpC family hydrolase
LKLSTRIRSTVGSAVIALAIFVFGSLVFAPAAYAAGSVTVGGKASVTNTDGDTIRVREGAGLQKKQISEVYQGDTVTVLAGPAKDSKGNTWYKIQSPRGTGWMLAGFLTGKGGAAVSTSAPAKAAQAAKPAQQPQAAPRIVGFAKVANTNGDHLRVRGAANGSVIAKFTPGTSVTVNQGPVVDNEGTTWYQVSANGVTGWAMGQYLTQAAAPAQPAAQAAAPAPAAPAAPAPAPAAPAAAPAPAQAPAAAAPATNLAAEVRNVTSRGAQPAVQASISGFGQTIVANAMRYLGARYRFGGMSPSGFDCSGFVKYVVGKSGKTIARDMGSMIASGTRVSSKDLQPGDLLFFSNTYKRGLSHAGIYIGNGKFIHAENERTGVVISGVWTAYWAAHYTTAVRLR